MARGIILHSPRFLKGVVGTDIAAFTEAMISASDIPDVGADIFRIREFDPADELLW